MDSMVSQFHALTSAAAQLTSPNQDDTFLVKCAIVGFSQHCATENWSKSDFEYVLAQLSDGTDGLGESDLRLKALCLGALCGLSKENRLTDRGVRLAEMHLPGLIMLNAGKI